MRRRRPTGEPRREAAAILVLATVLWTALAPPAAASFHDGPGTDHPIVHEATYENGVALGLRFDLSEPGTFRVDMVGHPPQQTTPVGYAVLSLNENRTYEKGFFVTTFDSRDRHFAYVDGQPVDDQNDDEPGLQIGPASVDGGSKAPTTDGEPGEKGCPLFCSVFVQDEDDTHAGSFFYVIWLGGTSSVDVRVFASEEVDAVHIREGTPHVFGDASMEDGRTSIQHQETHGGPGGPTSVGGKLLLDAREDRTIEERLWGMWALHGDKEVCEFGAVPVTCASTAPLKRTCTNLVPVHCDHARISWQGPAGSGTTGENVVFEGTVPGSYTFSVDRKVDGWSSPLIAPATGVEVRPWEHHTFLSAADVSLPPAPS